MGDKVKTKFCARITEIFEEYKDQDHNFKRQEFADVCGITIGQLDGWISGRSQPDLQTLVKIAERLKIRAAYLIGETDARTTEKVEFYQILPPQALEELDEFFNYLAHRFNIER